MNSAKIHKLIPSREVSKPPQFPDQKLDTNPDVDEAPVPVPREINGAS